MICICCYINAFVLRFLQWGRYYVNIFLNFHIDCICMLSIYRFISDWWKLEREEERKLKTQYWSGYPPKLDREMDLGGRRVSRGMLPLLALHTASEYYRLERKPPVTAGLLAANTLIYLRPTFLESILPNINAVWFNSYLILKVRHFIDYEFLSCIAVYHATPPYPSKNTFSGFAFIWSAA